MVLADAFNIHIYCRMIVKSATIKIKTIENLKRKYAEFFLPNHLIQKRERKNQFGWWDRKRAWSIYVEWVTIVI